MGLNFFQNAQNLMQFSKLRLKFHKSLSFLRYDQLRWEQQMTLVWKKKFVFHRQQNLFGIISQ